MRKIHYEADFVVNVHSVFPDDEELLTALAEGSVEFGNTLTKRVTAKSRTDLTTAIAHHDIPKIRALANASEGPLLLAEWIEKYKPVGYKLKVFA